jgi:hypothetical protein
MAAIGEAPHSSCRRTAGGSGCDLPKDLPPYSTVFWHYKQWRESGVIEKIMNNLHRKVRQQAKKNLDGQL